MTDEDSEELVEWRLSLDDLYFSTRVHTDEEASRSEAEGIALSRFIDALRDGDLTPTWSAKRMTMADMRSEAEYVRSQTCPRCRNYTEQEKREIVVDDDILYVCPDCVDDLRDICNECKRHRDELDEDESMEVTGRTVVEYLCSTCYANDAQTVEP